MSTDDPNNNVDDEFDDWEPWLMNFPVFKNIYEELYADDEEDEEDEEELRPIDELIEEAKQKEAEKSGILPKYEYCGCKEPEIVDSQAAGQAFKYCRQCKKEKLEEF